MNYTVPYTYLTDFPYPDESYTVLEKRRNNYILLIICLEGQTNFLQCDFNHFIRIRLGQCQKNNGSLFLVNLNICINLKVHKNALCVDLEPKCQNLFPLV
jgi:hypothetical protein